MPISHVYVSGEADRLTIFGTEEEPAKKNQHVENFQTMETKSVAMWSSKDEDTLGVAFAR